MKLSHSIPFPSIETKKLDIWIIKTFNHNWTFAKTAPKKTIKSYVMCVFWCFHFIFFDFFPVYCLSMSFTLFVIILTFLYDEWFFSSVKFPFETFPPCSLSFIRAFPFISEMFFFVFAMMSSKINFDITYNFVF